MKRICATFFCWASACLATTTFYIDSGSMSFGAGRGVVNSQITVTLTGAPASQQRSFIYFDFNGDLNISLPPGVSGSCSGGTCNIFTLSSNYTSFYSSTVGQVPNTANTGGWNYPIDFVYSATSSGCSTATAGILGNTIPFNWTGLSFATSNQEVGNIISADSAGYVCAIRFLKPSIDTSTSHTVHLWNSSNTQIASATSSGEASSGWISVPITPTAISAGARYMASYSIVNGGTYFITGIARNASPHNGPARLVGYYGTSDGSCSSTDYWPTNPDGLTAAGIVGCGDLKTDGTFATLYVPSVGGYLANFGGSRWGYEGCQCMIGGFGPGPYAFIGNRMEGSGNMWHHDDGGHWWSARSDYYYYRDVFTAPTYSIMGNVNSDGNRYWTRQKLEWKAGHRIYIGGSVFEYGQNDLAPSSDSIALSNMEYGIQDVHIQYSDFRNTVGGYSWEGSYANVADDNYGHTAPPAFRGLFDNNIFWNLSLYSTNDHNSASAYISNGTSGNEDYTFDHNTILPLRGKVPSLFHVQDTKSEGEVITNNIIPIDSLTQGFSTENSACTAAGEAGIACSWTNYQYKNNVLYPAQWSVSNNQRSWTEYNGATYTSTTTVDNIKSWYPTIWTQNYILNSTDVAAMKWFKLPSFPADNSVYATPGDYHLRSDSPAGVASTFRTTDGKPMGADMQAFAIAQGYVDHIGVPTSGITTSSANVVFIAPDSQACPVDYIVDDGGTSDITSGFTRVADTGTANRKRSVALTGLTANTPYRYQILCEVEQPLGRFRTR